MRHRITQFVIDTAMDTKWRSRSHGGKWHIVGRHNRAICNTDPKSYGYRDAERIGSGIRFEDMCGVCLKVIEGWEIITAAERQRSE